MTVLGYRLYVVSISAIQVLMQTPSRFVEKCILEEYVSYREDLHFSSVLNEEGPPVSHFNFLPGIFCR